MRDHPDRILLEDCLNRHVYRLCSRNLGVGVYDAARLGFIGIREKFGERYLFLEYHWDYGGGPYGTANPLEDLGLLPRRIQAKESSAVVDRETGRPVAFDRTETSIPLIRSRPDVLRPRGWYFLDTGEYASGIEAVSLGNQPLFDYLDRLA